MENQTEIWKSLPGVPGVEVSTFGNVRTLDKVTSSERVTRFIKGKILKQSDNGKGYLHVSIKFDGKFITKSVHQLVAQTFISNPDSLPEVNHKNCDRADNRIENLEWCTASYNRQYKENLGNHKTNLCLQSIYLRWKFLNFLHKRKLVESLEFSSNILIMLSKANANKRVVSGLRTPMIMLMTLLNTN